MLHKNEVAEICRQYIEGEIIKESYDRKLTHWLVNIYHRYDETIFLTTLDVNQRGFICGWGKKAIKEEEVAP